MSECEPLSDEELDRLACRGHGCKLGKDCKDRPIWGSDGRCMLNDIIFDLAAHRKRADVAGMSFVRYWFCTLAACVLYGWLNDKDLEFTMAGPYWTGVTLLAVHYWLRRSTNSECKEKP